jgi:hypothetical protein
VGLESARVGRTLLFAAVDFDCACVERAPRPSKSSEARQMFAVKNRSSGPSRLPTQVPVQSTFSRLGEHAVRKVSGNKSAGARVYSLDEGG